MNSKGLIPLKRDRRDWSFHKNFGATPLPQLADEYMLASTILDQNGWNECTGYMKAAIDESEFGLPFSPAFNYAMEGVEDPPVTLDGYQMRDPFAVGCDYGAVGLATGVPTEQSVGFPTTAQPATWSAYLTAALPYQHQGYMSIAGPYDVFDSIRSAMSLQAAKKRAVGVGVMWYNEWTNAPDGIIPATYSSQDGLHAIKIAGWTRHKTDGTFINPATQEQYLAIQNSWNTTVGDKGFFYFSRAIANKEFSATSLGIYIFTDNALQNPKTVSALQNMLNQLSALLEKLLASFGVHAEIKLEKP